MIGALLAVGKLGPQAVPLLPTLMKAWRPDNSDISGRIRQAIKGIGAAAVPHLIVWLKDAATVTLACDCLRDIGKDATAAIPSLVELLDKKGRTGRSLAADALGAIGDARVVPTLVSHIEPALGRVDPLLDEIAAHAARALGTMGPAAAGGIDALIAMLDCKRADDDVMHLRQQAALAIDDMGVPSAEAIAAVRRFAATVEGDVRRLATEVVERLDLHAGSKPERIASGLSSRSSELRRLALDCVAAQAPAPQTHLPLVVALLVHETLPDNQLAAIAAVLAIGVGSDEIAKALAALAKSADERIATAASSARETLQAK